MAAMAATPPMKTPAAASFALALALLVSAGLMSDGRFKETDRIGTRYPGSSG
jgi:hypothetical protein